jgi:urease accessory protein
VLALLHLCDSLFPIGAFSHSDGLEAATASGAVSTADDLRAWMDASLGEALARSDAPAVSHAWRMTGARQWDTLALLDADVHALRPSSSGREASRAMGTRLIRTWRQIRPSPILDEMADCAGATATLPVAFGAVCAASGIEQRSAVEGFIYTRLAATISSAMRLMPIGQHEAHALLSDTLARAATIVDRAIESDAPPAMFAPAFDIASMSQQYVHSRLFRS